MILSDIVLNCTMWEEYAAKFVQYKSDRKEAGPVIVLLKYCKIKEEGFNSLLDFSCFFNYLFTNIIFSIICLFIYDSCVFSIIINSGRYPLSVSNTYSFTKLFINDDMPEINMFRKRLVTLNQSCVFLLYSVYNRCRNWLAYGYIPIFNSLPKDDQTMSQSQILCTQSYSSSQLSSEEHLLANTTILPLSHVIHLDQVYI